MFSRLLEHAVRDNDLGALEQVLQGEVTGGVRPCMDDCESTLVRAAAHGHAECVSRLLAEGADPDCQDPDGDTPLHAAASAGHIDVVELLLFCDSDIDSQTFEDRTALHMAVWSGNFNMTRILLEKGCDVTLQDRYGDTPMMLCARRGLANSDILRLLLKYDTDVDAKNEEGDTALIYAARYGRTENAEILIEHGADVNMKNMWSLTPLLYASTNNYPDIVKLLVTSGADVHLTERSGSSALHSLARHGQLVCVQKLLKKGADINSQDQDGNTPLMEALVHNRVTMAEYVVVRAGCKVDFCGKATLGRKYRPATPLELAVFKGNLPLARLVHAAGGSLMDEPFNICAEMGLGDEDELCQWLMGEAVGPRSLLSLCRIAIRDHMGPALYHNVFLLPLPKPLKAYLKFAEFTN